MLHLVIALSLLSGLMFMYYVFQLYELRRRKERFANWFPERRRRERKSIFSRWGEAYDDSPIAAALKTKLEQANIPLKPSEYMALLLVIYLILWLIAAFLLKIVPPLDAVLAYFAVWILSRLLLNRRRHARAEAFNAQLPEVCRMLAGAVKAGYTLQQGFELIAKEMKPPAGQEFRTLSQELQLGDPFDTALERLGKRIDSNELAVFVHSLSIQRKLGGNIVEVMQMMATTLEERKRINEEIQNATAESRSIAYLLLFMPIIMVLMMGMIIPGFINPLFSIFGVILLAVAGAILLVAFILIRKISNIRV